MELEYELQTHRAEDRHWWYQGRRRVLERVIERLALPEHARILDAGCGSGRNMVELAHHGVVTGVELSDTSVRLARVIRCATVCSGTRNARGISPVVRELREDYEAFGVPAGSGSTGPFFGLMDPKQTKTLVLLVLSAGTYLFPFTCM